MASEQMLLERVARAAVARRDAEDEYRAAILGAVEGLGDRRDRFALVAGAAGVARQSVREMVARAATTTKEA